MATSFSSYDLNFPNPLKDKSELIKKFLAKQYLKFIPGSKFVGVSGDIDTTMTILLCKACLSDNFLTLASTDFAGNNSSNILENISSLILKVGPRVSKVLVELTIQNLGDMDLYLDLIRPQTVIIGRTQLADYRSENLKLIQSLPKSGLAILNGDDPYTKKLSEGIDTQIIYFGTNPQFSSVWAGNLRINDFQTIFELNYGVERVEIRSQLFGLNQIYPILSAAALGISLDIPLINIKKSLEKVGPIEHRMQALLGYNDSVIIDDTQSNNFFEIEEVMENLNQVSGRRRILVLGEIRNLGQYSERVHRGIARKIFKDKLDLVLLGSGDTKIIADELFKLGFLPDRIKFNLNNSGMVTQLLSVLSRGDIVLIKGDPAKRLDEVVKRITRGKKN